MTARITTESYLQSTAWKRADSNSDNIILPKPSSDESHYQKALYWPDEKFMKCATTPEFDAQVSDKLSELASTYHAILPVAERPTMKNYIDYSPLHVELRGTSASINKSSIVEEREQQLERLSDLSNAIQFGHVGSRQYANLHPDVSSHLDSISSGLYHM